MKKYGIIAISGSPGTGKTAVAELLAKKIGARIVEVKKLKIRHGYDKERKSKVIDPIILERYVRKIKENTVIVEGIPAHAIHNRIAIILRCRPDIMARRLKKRGWPERKIKENVEAEILDEITIEALEANRNVYEIDTSRISPAKVVLIAQNILNGKGQKYKAGHVDWTRKYARILAKKKRY